MNIHPYQRAIDIFKSVRAKAMPEVWAIFSEVPQLSASARTSALELMHGRDDSATHVAEKCAYQIAGEIGGRLMSAALFTQRYEQGSAMIVEAQVVALQPSELLDLLNRAFKAGMARAPGGSWT